MVTYKYELKDGKYLKLARDKNTIMLSCYVNNILTDFSKNGH